MKLYLKILAVLLAGASLLVSCDKVNGDEGNAFAVSTDHIDMLAQGGEESVTISSPGIWNSEVSEPWILVTPANGDGTTECKIFIDNSVQNDVRDGKIVFSSYRDGVTVKEEVKVSQLGYDKMICLDKDSVTIESTAGYDDRFIETEVVTNVASFRLEVIDLATGKTASWLVPSKKEYSPDLQFGARPQKHKVRLDWLLNTKDVERNAEVRFFSLETEKAGTESSVEPKAVLKVCQKAAPTIEDNRSGDSLTLILVQERLAIMGEHWDTAENMRNWDNVTLWTESDRELPCKEAIGRVRSAEFTMFNTQESIPAEIAHLKYAESLIFYSNVNTMLKSIDLGKELCGLEYLKRLTIGAYGLVSLPAEFVQLGNTLEYLDLGANNFTRIPEILNQENFPVLKSLTLLGNRRWTTSDLRNANDAIRYPDGIGMHLNTANDQGLRNLFLWDNLEFLRLSANYIEGSIPDFQVGDMVNGKKIEAYKKEDLKVLNDTVSWLLESPEGRQIPKILPNMKHLFLNLNFMTGKIPDWMLYHPYLMEWIPSMLVFNQLEKAIDSNGNVASFSNEPKTFDYYYEAYPLYRSKYEFKDVIE